METVEIINKTRAILGDRQSPAVQESLAALPDDGRLPRIEDGHLKVGYNHVYFAMWRAVNRLHAALGGMLDILPEDDGIRQRLSDFHEKLLAAINYVKFNSDGTITVGQEIRDNDKNPATLSLGQTSVLNATAETALQELFSKDEENRQPVAKDKIRNMQVAYLIHILECALTEGFYDKFPSDYDVRAAMQTAWFENPKNTTTPIFMVPAADLQAVGLSDQKLLEELISDAGNQRDIRELIPFVTRVAHTGLFDSGNPAASELQENRYSRLEWSLSPEENLLFHLTKPVNTSARVIPIRD